jgi:hypothetical protein
MSNIIDIRAPRMEPEGLQCGCQAAGFRSRLTDADEIRDRRPPGTGKVNHFEGIRAAFRCKSPGSCSLLPLRKSLVEAPNSTDADEECNSCHCLSSRTLSPNTTLDSIPSFPSLLKKTRLPLKCLPFHQAAPAFRYSRHQQTSSLGALAYTDHIYRHPRHTYGRHKQQPPPVQHGRLGQNSYSQPPAFHSGAEGCCRDRHAFDCRIKRCC